uniref:Uncharacterized protein n=2 Tax=Schistocephalus solidus TaxID=70667 RepID=A0A0X3P7H9_SCHSO
MDIRPIIIGSVGGADSAYALDCGWQRLVAFTNNYCISVIDLNNRMLLQSLSLHQSPIVQLRWAPENYYHDAKNPYLHRLASADASGRIIIWNVLSGSALAEGTEPGSAVCAIQWVPDQEISRDLLAVLHSDNKLILWNAQTCTVLWRKTYNDIISSFSFDPFSTKNILFQGPNSFLFVEDFSLNVVPSSPGRRVLFSGLAGGTDPTTVNMSSGRFSKAIRATAKAMIGERFFGSIKNSRPTDELLSEIDEIPMETPIQMLFHGFRKQHIILVYPREVVVFDMVLCQPVGSINLEQSSASFMRVYACRQADMLICLHVTGVITVHLGGTSTTPVPDLDTANCNLRYIKVGESRSLRRGRNFRILSMTVDPARELQVTVATSDGRLQFFELEPEQTAGKGHHAPTGVSWPSWTLTDLISLYNNDENRSQPPQLRLRLQGFYTGSSPTPTVCTVCPAHFILPLSMSSRHSSLIAIGTMRGSVQIWDAYTAKMWREYQVLNVPILGVCWGTISASEDKAPDHAAAAASADISGKSAVPIDNQSHGLSLFVHGWQPVESSCVVSCTPFDASSGQVRNFVVRLDLRTGQQQQVFSQRDGAFELRAMKMALQKTGSPCANKVGRWFTVASELADQAMSNVSCIRLMRVSHLGQYLAVLFENWPLEIWDAHKLVLLKSFPMQGCKPVTLTWSSANSQRTYAASSGDTGSTSSRSDADQKEGWDRLSSPDLSRKAYVRESLILCTSPINLKLFTIEGSEVDSVPISNTIIQSIPAPSCNNISCAAWRSPLIAFGTTDGCIAVRNLQRKETLIRTMSFVISPLTSNRSKPANTAQVSANLSVNYTVDGPGGTGSASVISAPMATGSLSLPAAVTHPTAIRKVEFLTGSTATSRLLVLCNAAVTVWEPLTMLLICIFRIGDFPQTALVDVTWSTVIASPSSAPVCALLTADGSIRLAVAGSASTNQNLIDSVDFVPPASEYSPVSQFEFGSPFSASYMTSDFPLIPSLLPNNVALLLRHLLQHQPWLSQPSADPPLIQLADAPHSSGDSTPPASSTYSLSCPPLSTGFSEVYSSANGFFAALKKVEGLASFFTSPTRSIVERCLLTALLFGDSYETAFWRLAAYRLLVVERPASTHNNHFTLGISWDTLADQEAYRNAVVERVNRFNQLASAEQSKLCTQYLLMLGFRKIATQKLAETQADAANFSLNVHRACLLAASVYIQRLEAESAETTHSAARLNYNSTVKLLAANMISNNHLHEGVELLCMLGLHVDACRYLETYNEWGTAVWLAKCALEKSDADEVMRRWAVHLASRANQKSLAILILVFLGQHEGVLNLLHSVRQHQLAARYLEACLEFGSLKTDSKSAKLHSQIYLEFARTLLTLGHKDSAVYYADLAGELGQPVREEADFLLS